MALTVFVNVQSMVKRKRRKVMKEYKVTVESGYRKTYYVEASTWEEAELQVTRNNLVPDEEEFLREEIDVEEV